MLLQTQDAGGPRGRFNFNASGTGLPSESQHAQRARQLVRRRSCSTGPNTRAARPEGHRRARHEALGDLASSSTTSGRRAPTSPSTSACAGRTTRRSRASRAPGRLSNYDPATNTLRVAGYGDTDNALNVKKTFTNFAPRTGVSWRLNDMTVVRAGYGASTIPFPDNRYAFNFPVKQNYSGIRRQRLPARRHDGGRLPGAGAADDPVERHHPGQPARCSTRRST